MDLKKHTDKALGIVAQHGKAALKQLVLEVGIPLAQEYVAETPTKLDDMVLNAVEQPIKNGVEAL